MGYSSTCASWGCGKCCYRAWCHATSCHCYGSRIFCLTRFSNVQWGLLYVRTHEMNLDGLCPPGVQSWWRGLPGALEAWGSGDEDFRKVMTPGWVQKDPRPGNMSVSREQRLPPALGSPQLPVRAQHGHSGKLKVVNQCTGSVRAGGGYSRLE